MKTLIIQIFLSLPILHVTDFDGHHKVSTGYYSETGIERYSSAIVKIVLPVEKFLIMPIIKPLAKYGRGYFDFVKGIFAYMFNVRKVERINSIMVNLFLSNAQHFVFGSIRNDPAEKTSLVEIPVITDITNDIQIYVKNTILAPLLSPQVMLFIIERINNIYLSRKPWAIFRIEIHIRN